MGTYTENIRLYEPGHRPPRLVAIGGGHGLSAMLRGLKRYTRDITAIVTVADDGGGSGALREDLGMLPPGDIRSCILSLANTEKTMRELLNYRFTEGSLAGQSFGNLFLAAMNGISGSFDEAVHRMGDVLAITLSVTLTRRAVSKIGLTLKASAKCWVTQMLRQRCGCTSIRH